MNYVERLVNRFYNLVNLNPSTLSGAVDILVVPQPDGQLLSTSFHVRFGKIKLIRPRQEQVNIYVNGQLIDGVHMVLSRSGEAYFLHEDDQRREAGPPEDDGVKGAGAFSDDLMDDSGGCGDADTAVSGRRPDRGSSETTTQPMIAEEAPYAWSRPSFGPKGRDLGYADADETPGLMPAEEVDEGLGPRPELVEVCDDDNLLDLSPPPTAPPLPPHFAPPALKPPIVPTFEVSLCSPAVLLNAHVDALELEAEFGRNLLSHARLFDAPGPNLNDVLVRSGGKYYPWCVGSMIMSSWCIYGAPPPDAKIEEMMGVWLASTSKDLDRKLWKRLLGWRDFPEVSAEASAPQQDCRLDALIASPFEATHAAPYPLSWTEGALQDDVAYRPEGSGGDDRGLAAACFDPEAADGEAGALDDRGLAAAAGDLVPEAPAVLEPICGSEAARPGTPPDLIGPPPDAATPPPPALNYIRSHKPTCAQLAGFNLCEGVNHVVFAVDSPVRGRHEVHGSIYLWPPDARIVVSDIDGTITRSDVLGQLLTVLGRDWSHDGVAELFKSIHDNGYKILYLSARAIGAANITKQFLMALEQDSNKLPDGPVFISPNRLLHSINREVITKNPEQFKINCLSEIKALFQDTADEPRPFYAGFGNRPNDTIAYEAVKIPRGRIFITNTFGEIEGVNKCIQHTYKRINDLVEQIFPPFKSEGVANTYACERWNDFNYWDTRVSYDLEALEVGLMEEG